MPPCNSCCVLAYRLRRRLTKGCSCSPMLITRSSVEPWKICSWSSFQDLSKIRLFLERQDPWISTEEYYFERYRNFQTVKIFGNSLH